MTLRTFLAAFALLFAGLVSTGPAVALTPAHAEAHAGSLVQVCTKTSTGSCIRGGQFCPKASYGRSGFDARGRRYVCKGDRNHPHWMLP